MLKERIFIITIACALDLVLGDPHWLWHPIRFIGWMIERFEKLLWKLFRLSEERESDKWKKQMAGMILVFLVILICTGGTVLMLYVADCVHHTCYLVLSVILCFQMLAACSLRRESMKVYRSLVSGNLEQARRDVSMIVGRDTACLDAEGITKAAVETVAENTSDGVIAPLIYMFLFGVGGGVAYKAINTMDSMLGYKNDRYCYFGTAAARTDDVVNLLPARVSAFFMILAAGILGQDMAGAMRIYRRDRKKHASPNSAQTESVCAGALDVQLAGNAYYFGKLYEKQTIGDAKRAIEPEDIRRANRMMYMTALLVFMTGIAILFVVSNYFGEGMLYG